MSDLSKIPYSEELSMWKKVLESVEIIVNIDRKDYNKIVNKFTVLPKIWVNWFL